MYLVADYAITALHHYARINFILQYPCNRAGRPQTIVFVGIGAVSYTHLKNDPDFINELNSMLSDYAGSPSRLYYAKRMTEDVGGAKIYLKREDLNHTGAHKINNVIGQMLLAKRMGLSLIHI